MCAILNPFSRRQSALLPSSSLLFLLLPIALLALCCPSSMADQQSKPPMVGGFQDQSVDDEHVQELVSKAVAKINAQSNSMFQLVPVRVLSAKSQVVSGIRHLIEVELGQSSCMKNRASADSVSDAKCSEQDANARKVYKLDIWEQPWLDKQEIKFEAI